uniref:Uncharacterized protein n=1 Tax=Octopus bimaculoides TaxID=37653 RepID=A0A0L8HZV6_OCTBM
MTDYIHKKKTKNKTKIINLSNKTLRQTEINTLARGLKFTPTASTPNPPEIKDDISEFCRKLRLTEAFIDLNNEDDSIIKNKSNFIPSKGRNKALDDFCNHIQSFP